LLSKENEKDIEEIPEMYINGLDFVYVDSMKEVLDYALLKEKVQNPLNIEAILEKDNKDK